MSLQSWLSTLGAREFPATRAGDRMAAWEIAESCWIAAHEQIRERGGRFSALWADEPDDRVVYALLWCEGQYYLLRTRPVDMQLPSVSRIWANADRPERYTRDMYGIDFTDALDSRRWARHQAWSKKDFPLLKDFPAEGRRQEASTDPDAPYGYHQVQGVQVYEIPVGPVHAGIIEPGHFRFNAAGERILSLEERLGYVHKGIEKRAAGQSVAQVARLASRVSGDSAVAHSLAFALAVEAATGLDCLPEAVQIVRAVALERERIANHLGDIGAICNDVGFAFMQMQCSRLRELWQRRQHHMFGHRLMMDVVVPGGLTRWPDRDDMLAQRDDIYTLRDELKSLRDILEDYPSLEDRLVGTGILRKETASVLGCLGYVGKASGLDFDVRVHAPTAPWGQLAIEPVVHRSGDVMARVLVRLDEIEQSLSLIYRLIDRYQPEGEACMALPAASDRLGLASVEGWRGETVHYVRMNADGTIARWFPRDPSWLNWPALEQLIEGNIVPDFPVCNKSVNGSYSGHDL